MQAVEGRKKFVAQLNEGWDADNLKMSEENNVFNQADVFELSSAKLKEELLFCVASSKNPAPEIISSAAVPDNGLLIFINVRLGTISSASFTYHVDYDNCHSVMFSRSDCSI